MRYPKNGITSRGALWNQAARFFGIALPSAFMPAQVKAWRTPIDQAANFSPTEKFTRKPAAPLLKNAALALLLAAGIQSARAQFKVVGYFPSWQGSVSAIQFSKLTHVNYAFVLPNSNGSLQALDNPTKLEQLVSAAHANNVKVLIAVGGWNNGDDSAFEALAANATSRNNFVNNLVNLVNQYNLDGVDIDWEYPDTSAESSNYTTLMSQLATAMHTRGKLLTAAVVSQGATADFISSSVFSSVDFLNLMNYDNNNFQHSTYDSAVSCLNYWINTRGLPASKAVQGVPFYSRPSFTAFNTLLSQGANPNADTFNGQGYNGLITISNKTHLSFNRNAGGMMIWELSQDATGANSLLSKIHQVVQMRQGGPDFSIAATPSSRTITAGASTTYTVTITPINGFNSTVTLAASGLPTGASASFNPAGVTGSGSSTMTVTTSASTPTGARTLTITGTSGTRVHSTTVSLTVNAPSTLPAPWVSQDIGAVAAAGSASHDAGTFTVNASGADIWSTADEFHFVNQAITGDVDIRARVVSVQNTHAFAKAGVMIRESLAANSKQVLMAVTPGGTATFVRRNAAGAACTSSNATTFNAPYWVRLTRVGNTLSAFRSADGVTWTPQGSTNIAMTSQVFVGLALSSHLDGTICTAQFSNVSVGGPAPDFTINATPSLRTINPGATTTYSTAVGSLNGFSGSVALSVSGLPAGAAGSFNPASVTGSGSSTLTVTTSGSTPPGNHILTITGTSGALVHSTNVSLLVEAAPTDFSLSVSPSSQTITAGGPDVTCAINSTANNFSSAVTLSVSGLPAGVSGSFSPNPITPPQSSTLTISAGAGAVAGTYNFTVTGTGGGLTRTANGTLIVSGGPTPGVILQEAELLPRTSSGASLSVVTDAAASNGQWVSLTSSNVGNFVEYTLTNVPAGTYGLGLIYKRHQNRGIHNLTVDGVQLDGTLNQYGTTVAFLEKPFGNILFTAPGNHTVRLTVTGKDAAAGNHNISADAFRLTSTNETWLSQDIGAVGVAGSFTQTAGGFTIAGSGADIWSTADQFRYAYQYISGDIDVVARVVTLQQTHAYAKAGVMIRQSLATNSVHASVLITPTNGVSLHIRPTTGATSINVSGWVKPVLPPRWLRLSRAGNTFTAFHSADGVSWTQFSSTNVTMSAGATAGMAVTSHNNAVLNTATFE